MKYRKKPVVVEAIQWFKDGDHPEVTYPMPNVSRKADIRCEKCTKAIGKHGWIDTLEGGHIVCPADWIITGIQGEFYPCKPDIFNGTYDEAGKPSDLEAEVKALREALQDIVNYEEARRKLCSRDADIVPQSVAHKIAAQALIRKEGGK